MPICGSTLREKAHPGVEFLRTTPDLQAWHPNGILEKDRGPCVIVEYESFRDLNYQRCTGQLAISWNQYRRKGCAKLQIPPFVKARTVLEGLVLKDEDKNKVKKEITVLEGDPGPMVPKGAKSRKIMWKRQKDDHDYTDSKKAKKTRTDSTAKAKPVKKEENLKVKKENATSKTQNASKRQKTNTEKINAAPANENKPKTRGTRSSKVPPKTGTKTIKSQRVEEMIKTKRNSVACRKSATKGMPSAF
ncbi:hypothetical protein cypCar_00008257 [Cyprinus carpio]|nr:hypothetical protein cypCar_00008257 [Cyprinus carpio]